MSTEIILGGRFRLGKKIGSGAFGEIYSGTNIETDEAVAIKLEPVKTKYAQLLYEARVMRFLVGEGIPIIHWFGIEGDYNVLVMDLLGPSLEELFNYCNRKFTLKTVMMLADQIIAKLEYIHSRGFVHRDIKPDNFLVGAGMDANQVFVIDFGLAKRFKDSRTSKHIPYKSGKNLTGTARYASINAHMGLEQSRRDDLESVCYILIYFLRGSLPWQGLEAKTKIEKYRKIMDSKIGNSPETLCKGFPGQLVTMVKYCKGLKFEEDPDYNRIRMLIKQVFINERLEYDFDFDWLHQQTSVGNKLPFLMTEEEEDSGMYDFATTVVLTDNRKQQKRAERKYTAELDVSKSIIEQKALGVNCPSFFHSVISPTAAPHKSFDFVPTPIRDEKKGDTRSIGSSGEKPNNCILL